MSITIRSAQTIQGGVTLQGSIDPSIILWLDADNTRSYPGTGTTWYDLSSNHYDATLYNGANFVNGNAINFDYTQGQYAALAPNSMLGGDMTAIGWVYVRSYQSWSRLFDFGNGAGSQNVILAVSDGTTGTPVYSIGNNLNGNTTVPLNQWVQLVGIQNGFDGYLYMNGQQIGVLPSNGSIPNVIRNYNYIGRSNWGSDAYLDGKISYLKIYNRVLSPAEITLDYNAMIARLG